MAEPNKVPDKTIQELDEDINELVQVINILLPRIETLERKCQGLPNRPLVKHCPKCKNRISGPNPNCPTCGIVLENYRHA